MRNRRNHYFLLALVGFLGLALVLPWLPQNAPQPALAATGLTVTAGATSTANQGWTNPSNAQGTGDDNVYATAAPGLNATINGDWGTYGFDSSLPADATVTKVEIIPQYHITATLPLGDSVTVQAVVSGTTCPTTAVSDTSLPTADTDFTADVTSCRTWTRANLLNAAFSVRIAGKRSVLDLTGITFSLDRVQVRITYNIPATTQSNYRLFTNSNGTGVGAALAAQNTTVALASYGQAFRLRQLIAIADAILPASTDNYKLQFVGKGAGTCASPSGGTPSSYTDVTTSTAIAYNDNATPADGAALTTNAGDPTDAARPIVAQTYEEANNFTNTAAVAIGSDGLWDFSLKDNNGPARTYCFRMAKSDGTALDTYSSYAEVTTTGTLNVDIVDSGGSAVTSPTVAFSASTVAFNCQTVTATLGAAAQKIRLTNTTSNPQWSLSIAATSGATANWSASGNSFDFNDASGSPAGCSDGADTDSLAGQLTIDPSVTNITPQSGCTSTGLTLGPSSAFSEGVTNAITLISGGAGATTNCYWDLTGLSLSQTLPKQQPVGNYALDMTITVIAL